jgi:putative ABC transport system substrate-binding protein
MGASGHIEGQTFRIVFRYANGNYHQIWALAEDLVRLNPKVLVAAGTGSVGAAKRATQTLPIVMMNAPDPLGHRFISELARPGGNITGLTSMALDLSGKRLEFLKEAVPKTSHVTVLWNPIVPQSHVSYGDFNELKETETVARSLGMQFLSVEARSARDLEQAFSRMTAARADALVVLTDGMFNANRSHIVQLASKSRIPATIRRRRIHSRRGLMVYAPSTDDLGRRTATYVDDT